MASAVLRADDPPGFAHFIEKGVEHIVLGWDHVVFLIILLLGARTFKDVIKLASSYPQSGLTAAFSEIARGWESYFEKVNAEGGVDIGDRTFTFEFVDMDEFRIDQ